MSTDWRSETVTLRRANRGVDLWPLLEASQYARILEHEAPRPGAETAALAEFVDRVGAYAEAWEETASDSRGALLGALDGTLARLATQRLYVHWGVVGWRVTREDAEATVMPLAVVRVGRCDQPHLLVELPAELPLER